MSYSVKGKPWDYAGAVKVEDCQTSEEVMIKSGLNWTVEKCPLMAKMPYSHEIKDNNTDAFFNFRNNSYREFNSYAVYRTDHNIPLGIVKERYTPVQNIEAFNFFDKAIGKNKAIWQTAGFFGNGERIFVSAKLPKNIFVNGDPVENYLLFTTSHDGSSGVKILFTPIRVVCQNTLNAAIRSATNFVSFKHTSSVHKNIDIANEILGICENKIEYTNKCFNRMAKVKVSDEEAQNVFASVILNDNELTNMKATGHTIKQIINRNYTAISDSNISMKKVNALSEINNYYFTGVGQREITGTAWGVYGAVTGYYSNVDNAEGTKRMDSILFGNKSKKIETVGNILVNW